MITFDGRAHAIKLDEIIAARAAQFPLARKSLVIIQVGDNPVSEKYIKLKLNLCQKVGVPVQYVHLSASLSDSALLNSIAATLQADSTGGCIIQLPLPRLSLNSVLDLIPLGKDLDLLSSTSMNQFMVGHSTKWPPVVRAVDHFIQLNSIDLQNKSVIVVGQGKLVGGPVAYYLARLGAKVSVLDNYKTGAKLVADLVVLSAGVPRLVNGQDISPDCSVIDFGSSVIDGKTVGDLNMLSSLDHLANVSPSPGGMGPLVVRFLIMNYLGI